MITVVTMRSYSPNAGAISLDRVTNEAGTTLSITRFAWRSRAGLRKDQRKHTAKDSISRFQQLLDRVFNFIAQRANDCAETIGTLIDPSDKPARNVALDDAFTDRSRGRKGFFQDQRTLFFTDHAVGKRPADVHANRMCRPIYYSFSFFCQMSHTLALWMVFSAPMMFREAM